MRVSLLALLLALLPMGVGANPWGVQLGAFKTGTEAEAKLSEARTGGVEGAFVESGTEWNRVVVGPFEYLVEAQLVRDDLRAGDYPDAFLRDLKDAGEGVTARERIDTSSAMKPFFRAPATAAELPLQNLKGNTAYEQLETIDKAGDKAAYEAALLAALPSISGNDPLLGYVYTNLGICEIIKKDYEKAMTYLEPVANGDVASAAAHRVMAMNRVAWITHWQRKDRLAAYRAYRQIHDFSGSESVKANCRVECIGLMMELAESGKGTHDEVRAEITKALAAIPETDIKHRATIELMNMETYFRQPLCDATTGARLGEAFIAKYEAMGDKAPRRELVAAVFQTGWYHQRNSNREAAKRFFDKVLKEFPENVDTFAGFNPHAQALHGYALLAADSNDWDLQRQIMRDVVELYPDDGLSEAILKVMPTIREDLQPSPEILRQKEERK